MIGFFLKLIRKVLVLTAWCAGILGLLYGCVLFTTCATESKKTITGLSGFDFEISETDCSGFGHTASMSVFAWQKRDWRRTLLFKFDPLDWIELPTISVPEPNKIHIAVPRVSSIFSRRYEWRGMRIEYEIGKIDNPGGEDVLDEKK
jgi:hypothetical protein